MSIFSPQQQTQNTTSDFDAIFGQSSNRALAPTEPDQKQVKMQNDAFAQLGSFYTQQPQQY